MVDEEGFKGGGWAGKRCCTLLFAGFSLDAEVEWPRS